MGVTASVMSRNVTPSTCRICLSSSQEDELECAASEIPRFEIERCHDDYPISAARILMVNQMLSPCDCSGTQEHVHLHCLLKWIAVQPSREALCEICLSNFKGPVVSALENPAIQSFFRIHRTLFASCTTNNRYDRSHSLSLSLPLKDSLAVCMRAGCFILQTRSRAANADNMDQTSSSAGSVASQLVAVLLTSRRAHWNASAFLVLFSRPRAASDGSVALIAVNITQQLPLYECQAALEIHRCSGVRCSLYRGGPCKSNRPMAVLSIEAADNCWMLFEMAKAVYHPNLVHTWQSAQPPCCFYR
jgi:hypothetical protein